MPALWDEIEHLWSRLWGRVLDAGCGNGLYTQRLLEGGTAITEVVGIDSQPIETPYHGVMFRNNAPNARWVMGDVRDMHMFEDGEFDCIWCSRVLHHLPDAERALREFARVMRAGGLVLIRIPPGPTRDHQCSHGAGPDDIWAYHTLWTPAELETHCLGAGLKPASESYIDQQPGIARSQQRLFGGGEIMGQYSIIQEGVEVGDQD